MVVNSHPLYQLSNRGTPFLSTTGIMIIYFG